MIKLKAWDEIAGLLAVHLGPDDATLVLKLMGSKSSARKAVQNETET